MKHRSPKLKIFLLIFLVILFIFSSCTTGYDRINALKQQFPSARISTFTINSTDFYCVDDTLKNQIYIVEFFYRTRIDQMYRIR
jgi:hypothetical protein